jgi:hypothetical protein
MGLNVAWVNESHEPLEQILDFEQVLTGLATSRWPSLSKTVCLQFVEPWGDTVFNQTQIPILLNELRVEASTTKESTVRQHLEKVIELVGRSVDQIHTYIKFIGD